MNNFFYDIRYQNPRTFNIHAQEASDYDPSQPMSNECTFDQQFIFVAIMARNDCRIRFQFKDTKSYEN